MCVAVQNVQRSDELASRCVKLCNFSSHTLDWHSEECGKRTRLKEVRKARTHLHHPPKMSLPVPGNVSSQRLKKATDVVSWHQTATFDALR